MKYVKALIWLIFCSMSFLGAQQKPLKYNTIIEIISAPTQQSMRKLWTFPGSRSSTCFYPTPPTQNGALATASADANFDILAGGDSRAESGPQYFMLKKDGDLQNTGNVAYGDVIQVYSLSTVSAQGWGGTSSNNPVYNANFTKGERRWFVNNAAYYKAKNGGSAYWEIFSGKSDKTPTVAGSEKFTLKNVANSALTGVVNQGDTLRIVSKASYATTNLKPGSSNNVWCFEASFWGSTWYSLLIGEDSGLATDRASDSHSYFVIQEPTDTSKAATVYSALSTAFLPVTTTTTTAAPTTTTARTTTTTTATATQTTITANADAAGQYGSANWYGPIPALTGNGTVTLSFNLQSDCASNKNANAFIGFAKSKVIGDIVREFDCGINARIQSALSDRAAGLSDAALVTLTSPSIRIIPPVDVVIKLQKTSSGVIITSTSGFTSTFSYTDTNLTAWNSVLNGSGYIGFSGAIATMTYSKISVTVTPEATTTTAQPTTTTATPTTAGFVVPSSCKLTMLQKNAQGGMSKAYLKYTNGKDIFSWYTDGAITCNLVKDTQSAYYFITCTRGTDTYILRGATTPFFEKVSGNVSDYYNKDAFGYLWDFDASGLVKSVRYKQYFVVDTSFVPALSTTYTSDYVAYADTDAYRASRYVVQVMPIL